MTPFVLGRSKRLPAKPFPALQVERQKTKLKVPALPALFSRIKGAGCAKASNSAALSPSLNYLQRPKNAPLPELRHSK